MGKGDRVRGHQAGVIRGAFRRSITSRSANFRADEQRLRAKVQGDVLERLLKAMAEEKKRLRASGGDVEGEVLSLKDLRPAADESKD
jgi:hypothetical protein